MKKFSWIFSGSNRVKVLMIMLVVVIVLLSSTLAYYNWGSGEDSNTNVAFDVVSDCATINYNTGADIIGTSLYPTDDKSDGIVKEITFNVDKYNANAKLNLYLDIKTLPDSLKHESFRYALYSGGSVVKEGNFKDYTATSCTTNSTNHIVLLEGVVPSTEVSSYTLYIWIDGVNYTNPDSMMNQSFEFTLHADGVCLKSGASVSLANYITSMYNEATKEPITTIGGESITQVSTLKLMQDSYGNIRYYGDDPDNYVTFNGEESGWRIIGLFEVEDENGSTEKRVKLIRDSSINTLSFDNNSSSISYGSNDWSESRLMMLLNPGYETPSTLYSYEGSLYWNKRSGTCYSGQNNNTKSCNFTSNGLTTEGKNMIGEANFYLGEISTDYELYADDFYELEREGTNFWNGYVGIMYASDFLYASDLRYCLYTGWGYANSLDCYSTNWLISDYPYYYEEWTISPYYAYIPNIGIAFRGDGYVENSYVSSSYHVRPVVYLRADIGIVDGTGDIDDPYTLGYLVNND